MSNCRQGKAGLHPLDELVQLLRLQRVDASLFRGGSCSRSLPFVFGGQVAAQALAAAYTTVPLERRVHSLHSYFLAAGDPSQPLDFRVETTREGRSFSVRQVVVTQEGPPIYSAMLSFHRDEQGLAHGESMPSAPEPEQLPRLDHWLREHVDSLPRWWHGPMAIDLRYVLEPPHVLTRPRPRGPYQRLWMRSDGQLPADPRVHDCVFTFASDLTLLDPVLLGHDLSWYTGRVRAASLDHTIWFHRPSVMDAWVLYDQSSPSAFGAVGLAIGHAFSRAGDLLATVSQQGLVRVQD
jgi:acyl-CoA thioesterase II